METSTAETRRQQSGLVPLVASPEQQVQIAAMSRPHPVVRRMVEEDEALRRLAEAMGCEPPMSVMPPGAVLDVRVAERKTAVLVKLAELLTTDRGRAWLESLT